MRRYRSTIKWEAQPRLHHAWTLAGCRVREADRRRAQTVRFCLYETSRTGKSMVIGKLMVARAWAFWGEWVVTFHGFEVSLGRDVPCYKIDCRSWTTSVNILKAAELNTFDGWIVWYVNYISISCYEKRKKEWTSKGIKDTARQVRPDGQTEPPTSLAITSHPSSLLKLTERQVQTCSVNSDEKSVTFLCII